MELSYYIRKVLIDKLKPIENLEFVIVSNLSENVLVIIPTENDKNIISGEKISYLVYRIWKLLKDSNWGNMEEIYIKGENKGIIAVPFHNNELFIGVVFKYPINLSVILSAIKETLKELKAILVGWK